MGDKFQAFWNNVKTGAATFWSAVIGYVAKVSAPVLSLLALIGVVLAIAKYKDLIIKLISWTAKKEVENVQKEDSVLRKQEDADKQQAADLVKHADQLGQQGADDNWYKKDN